MNEVVVASWLRIRAVRWMGAFALSCGAGLGTAPAQAPQCNLKAVASTVQAARQMPEVGGCPAANVFAILKKADLYVLPTIFVQGPVAAGQIVKQSPAPGTQLTGAVKVQLTASDGSLAGTEGVKGSAGQPDLSINGSLDTPAPYTAGETIAYTFYINNGGKAAARDIRVEGLNAGNLNLEVLSVSGRTDAGPVPTCGAGSCVLPYVPPGRGADVNVSARVLKGGTFATVVTMAPAGKDADLTNNVWTIRGTAAGAGQGSDVPPAVTNLRAEVELRRGVWPKAVAYAGENVALSIVVTNGGPGRAQGIVVASKSRNLAVTPHGGGCSSFPCPLGELDAGASTEIPVYVVVTTEGPFEADFFVSSSEQKAVGKDRSLAFKGTATQPPPPPSSKWLAWTAGGLGLLGVGGLLRHWWRRKWWNAHTSVVARVDRLEVAGSAGRIPFAAPAVRLEVAVLPGAAARDGKVLIKGRKIVP